MTTTLNVSREVLAAALGESLLPGFKIDRLVAICEKRQDGSFEIEIDCAALPPGEVEIRYDNYDGPFGGRRAYVKEIRRVETIAEAAQ